MDELPRRETYDRAFLESMSVLEKLEKGLADTNRSSLTDGREKVARH